VDLLDSHVDVGFESVPGVISYIRGHQLRASAVASEKRLSNMPDVPTLKELGLKEFVAAPWWAVLAPASTPRGGGRRIERRSSQGCRVAGG
jgi:tripartite-type tricarboxylate transporter receptor subunit TctC